MSEGGREPIRIEVVGDLEPLIPGFLENRRADVAELRASLADADADALEALGHQLKGTGGGYGFDGLTDLGGEIERAAVAGDLEAVAEAIDRIEDYLQRVEVVYV